MKTGTVLEIVAGDQLIPFGNWSGLKKNLERYSLCSTEDEFLDLNGVTRNFYDQIINFSISRWRHSTSCSMFQIVGHHGLEIPQQGTPIFTNHLEQTRFFHLLDEAKILSKVVLGHVVDQNNEKVKVKGNVALTYPAHEERRKTVEAKVNQVLQAVFIYAFLCKEKEKEIKLPKKLYRGIRLGDVGKLRGLKEQLSEVKYEPSKRDEFARRRTEIIRDFIENHGLNGIAESPLLSFTSSKSVASYFANKRGFVLEIDVKDVEVLTSELHDLRMNVQDFISGKFEREYMVRLPKNQVKVQNIIIEDLDYLVAINDPMSVNYFNHNDKVAFYTLNGTKVKAQYQWSSNTKGSIRYANVDDKQAGWFYGSREFKQQYGFSPVITQKNVKDIQDFHIERN